MNSTIETFSIEAAAAALSDLREQRPLVQNITNYVAMTVSANVLLALGASPAMVHAPEEAADFAAISSSLVVNIGTLSESWVDGMRRAIMRMNEDGKPWVLDPVGCGATPYRTAVAVELSRLSPAIIRGNASEIMSLAGASGAGGKGADSTVSSDAALDAAVLLARETGAVVAVTGEIDYVTDGRHCMAVMGGDPLMPFSTALGCALSGTVAAFAAVRPPFEAALAALAVYGAAGAKAAEGLAGPGLLPQALCDTLYVLDAATIEGHAAVKTVAIGSS